MPDGDLHPLECRSVRVTYMPRQSSACCLSEAARGKGQKQREGKDEMPVEESREWMKHKEHDDTDYSRRIKDKALRATRHSSNRRALLWNVPGTLLQIVDSPAAIFYTLFTTFEVISVIMGLATNLGRPFKRIIKSSDRKRLPKKCQLFRSFMNGRSKAIFLKENS